MLIASYPISIESFPGNTLDANTFKSAITKSIDGLEYSRFIMIADRGMCNYQNIFHLLDQNNGYIIAKSLLKSSKAEQEWAYSDMDFIHENKDFKYKSRIMKRTIKDSDGEKRTVTENKTGDCRSKPLDCGLCEKKCGDLWTKHPISSEYDRYADLSYA